MATEYIYEWLKTKANNTYSSKAKSSYIFGNLVMHAKATTIEMRHAYIHSTALVRIFITFAIIQK